MFLWFAAVACEMCGDSTEQHQLGEAMCACFWIEVNLWLVRTLHTGYLKLCKRIYIHIYIDTRTLDMYIYIHTCTHTDTAHTHTTHTHTESTVHATPKAQHTAHTNTPISLLYSDPSNPICVLILLLLLFVLLLLLLFLIVIPQVAESFRGSNF